MKHLKILIAALLVVVPFTFASGKEPSDLEVDFNDNEIRVAVSKEIARGVVEGLIGEELECDGAIDGGMRMLLEELEREGPRARATYRDDESTIDGRRRGGNLNLKIHGSGKGKIEVTMPWKLARCMLGGTTTLDRSITSSVKVKVTSESGKRFSFKLQ